MANYWIVSSKHSRDEGAENWNSKWTADGFLRARKFYPSLRRKEFLKGAKCILKVFKSLEFIGDFEIASIAKKDRDGDVYFDIDQVNEWDFPIHEDSLPDKYSDLLSRSTSTDISRGNYFELIGIRNFAQNLKLNYKKRLVIEYPEKHIEDLLASIQDPLRNEGFMIIERQYAVRSGNRIDLICKDRHGDLVVVELKRRSSDATVGQLARYVGYIREKYAKSTQKTSGMILTSQVDDGLIKAARTVGFEVMLYQISFQ